MIKKAIIFLIFLSVLGFFLYLSLPKDLFQRQQPSVWNELKVGTSKENFYQALGAPISESAESSTFNSKNPARPYLVTFTNDQKAEFIKRSFSYGEVPPPPKRDDLVKQYGEPTILYGEESDGGIYLYVNADKGVAYLASEVDGTVFELWSFPPTSLEEFNKKWAPSYSDKLPQLEDQ